MELASIDGCKKNGTWPPSQILTLAMRRWCWTTSELHEWKMRHDREAIAKLLDRPGAPTFSCTEAAALLRAKVNGSVQMGAAASSFYGLDTAHTDPFIADPASIAANIRITPAHITVNRTQGVGHKYNATKSPFLVVLGAPLEAGGGPGPWLQERMLLATRRYFELVAANKSPYILLTGGGTRRAATGGLSEASVMQRIAQEAGVPPQRLLLEADSEDTLQNAVFSGRLLVEHGARSIEVITSGFHVARARSYFEPILRAFGSTAALSVHGNTAGLADDAKDLLARKERLLTRRSARVLELVARAVHTAQVRKSGTTVHTGL